MSARLLSLLSFIVLAVAQAIAPAAQASPAELVAAARSQVGVTLSYDPRYERLAYPGGDVPIERGVCTDVIVRAYRKLGQDLQVLVHQDMKQSWAVYQKQGRWQMKAPDRNIDHRRVPNLATFLARHGTSLAVSKDGSAYRPGDIVTWMLPGNLTHIGIVSDKRTGAGTPLMIHNIGAGTREENMLFDFPVTGHYRWQPK